MTTFGHSLTGLAMVALIIPPSLSWGRRLVWVAIYIALASIPDWPLPIWGHSQLAISHSLWVNMALCATAVFYLWKWLPIRIKKLRVMVTGALAWLSHIGLDTLYGDLPGVAIYWPFSDGLASLPLPWLRSLPHVPPPFDAEIASIFIFEGITFAPIFLLAYGLRRMWLK